MVCLVRRVYHGPGRRREFAKDIILSMDGQALRNTAELSKFLISHQPGDTVNVTLLRDGGELTAGITLGGEAD